MALGLRADSEIDPGAVLLLKVLPNGNAVTGPMKIDIIREIARYNMIGKDEPDELDIVARGVISPVEEGGGR